jgi:SecD/SecF fusion protein
VYALTERELTTATVAALLTIMGYSLYDTIIVFDRIRENVPRMPRATFSQIANRSMSEVLTRSLATSFTVLMPVGALLLFGGETLKDFAFALLVGVASGAYSSIFIATPVLVEWKEREQVYMRRRRLVMEQHGGLVPAFATGSFAEETAVPAPVAATSGAREARSSRASRRAAQRRAGTGRATPAAAPPPSREGRAAPDSAPPPSGAGSEVRGGRPAPDSAPPPSGPGSEGAPSPPRAPATPRPDAAPAEPREAAPPPDVAPAEPVPPSAPAPGGDGAPAARPSSPRTSTAGDGAPSQRSKSKSKRQRARKKHGRR